MSVRSEDIGNTFKVRITVSDQIRRSLRSQVSADVEDILVATLESPEVGPDKLRVKLRDSDAERQWPLGSTMVGVLRNKAWW
jgi:hypothetical protein